MPRMLCQFCHIRVVRTSQFNQRKTNFKAKRKESWHCIIRLIRLKQSTKLCMITEHNDSAEKSDFTDFTNLAILFMISPLQVGN